MYHLEPSHEEFTGPMVTRATKCQKQVIQTLEENWRGEWPPHSFDEKVQLWYQNEVNIM